MNDPIFKVVLLGQKSVGKTSLVLRIVRDIFNPRTKTTIGGAYCVHTVYVDERKAKLGIWDTAGEERYHSLAPMYYRGSDAAIVVYDITDPSSLLSAKNWIQELQDTNQHQTLIILIGNKTDLSQERGVTTQEGQEYAEKIGAPFFETSAKLGQNIQELLLTLARTLLDKGEKLHVRNQSPVSRQTKKEETCCQK